MVIALHSVCTSCGIYIVFQHTSSVVWDCIHQEPPLAMYVGVVPLIIHLMNSSHNEAGVSGVDVEDGEAFLEKRKKWLNTIQRFT